MGPDTDVVEALRVWRDGLINLTGTNRALNFRHTKSGTVAIDAPDLHTIFGGLQRGVEWAFEGEPDSDSVTGETQTARTPPSNRPVLHCRKPEKELDATLRNLARRAKQEYLDRGLSVMYVALGALRWRDVDDTAYTSPLLLVPVRVHPHGGQGTGPGCRSAEDDPTLNPALGAADERLRADPSQRWTT